MSFDVRFHTVQGDPNSKISVQDVLKPGSQMVAAGYCM